MSTEFHGTGDEGHRLLDILEKNCECKADGLGRKKLCDGHLMLLNDQRALDGLVWMRQWVGKLMAAEGITGV